MSKLVLIFNSYGLKRNRYTELDYPKYLIPRADVYLDCRCVPDMNLPIPTEDIELFELTILRHLAKMPTRRRKYPFKNPVSVLFMCAWGSNRSPRMKQALRERFMTHYATRYRIYKTHSDLTEIIVKDGDNE
jgi:hypothetical protein